MTKKNKRYMGKYIDAKLLPKDASGLTCCRCVEKELNPQEEQCVHRNVYMNYS